MESIAYLDTHVVVWLFYGELDLLSNNAKEKLERSNLLISPMVSLELDFLKEIKRIEHSSTVILNDLKENIGLDLCSASFAKIVEIAGKLTFTRDPFDRIIIAYAMIKNSALISKDRLIKENYNNVVW